MLLQESSYDSPLPTFDDKFIPDDLLEAVLGLPVLRERETHFVDLDGTILDDTRRFEVLPILKNHRGNAAYPVIVQELSKTGDVQEAFKAFIERIDPKNHLLNGYTDFFDIENPDHVILTAGNRLFQSLKIQATGLNIPKERIILVDEAGQKPQAMFEYFLKQRFVPGQVRFFDDRIAHFSGKDTWISQNLGIDVSFYQAIPTKTSVNVMKHTNKDTAKILESIH